KNSRKAPTVGSVLKHFLSIQSVGHCFLKISLSQVLPYKVFPIKDYTGNMKVFAYCPQSCRFQILQACYSLGALSGLYIQALESDQEIRCVPIILFESNVL